MDDDDANHHPHHYHQHHQFTFPVDLHHFLNPAAAAAYRTTSSPFHLSTPFPTQQPYPDLYITHNVNVNANAPPPPSTFLAPLQYLIHGEQQAQSHQQHQHDFDVNVGRHVTDMLHQGTEVMGMDLGLHELETAGRGVVPINNNVAAATASSGGGSGFDPDGGGGGYGGGATSSSAHVDAGGGCSSSGRWPREETLTLLDIRSRLDYKFKEANQKGPLWEEVSSIMLNEHGYKRSAKKCREKFENLYKYFKKTKEGKAGRQDGKSYRFFRQLEALHRVVGGKPTTINNKGRPHSGSGTDACSIGTAAAATGSDDQIIITNNDNNHGRGFHRLNAAAAGTSKYQHLQAIGQLSTDSLSSLSDSSGFHTHSSEDSDRETLGGSVDENGMGRSSMKKKKKKKKNSGNESWKAMMEEFIDTQMRGLAEKQEALMDKMMRTLEHNEQERMKRQEQWRKQENDRAEGEQRFWANERARIQTRDAALMAALEKLMGATRALGASSSDVQCHQRDEDHDHIDHEGRPDGEDVGEDRWPETEISRKNKEHMWNQKKRKDKSWRNIDQKDDDEDGNRRVKEDSAMAGQEGATPCQAHDHVHGDTNCVGDCCFGTMVSEGENVWEKSTN